MLAKIKIKKMHSDAVIPSYGSENSAGFDLYSVEDYELKPGETVAIKTGISSEFSKDLVCLIWDRSSLGCKGIHKFAGVIDSDYRGEWKIVLHNHTGENFYIKKGERIAQAIIQEYYKAEFEEADELSYTSRGKGGFGSTGQ